jgi:pimeloyl-ACP methyl ester carboxylesterase
MDKLTARLPARDVFPRGAESRLREVTDMAVAATWKDQSLTLSGIKVHVSRAGKGSSLLLLHHDIGTLERLPFYDELAAKLETIIPHHPGWGRSQRAEWMRHPRDIAILYQALLAEMKVEKPTLLGLGFGGWIAAEMATMAPSAFARLILVGAMGVKPPEGDILDQAIISYIDYAKAGFHDPKAFTKLYGDVSTDQLEAWDIAREMSFRLAWKPYMYSQTLPHLMSSIRAPTLVVWGDNDKVVPRSAGERIKAAIPGARLEIVEACGHCVEMEKPAELMKLVAGFV